LSDEVLKSISRLSGQCQELDIAPNKPFIFSGKNTHARILQQALFSAKILDFFGISDTFM
jgi:hypothetical protein